MTPPIFRASLFAVLAIPLLHCGGKSSSTTSVAINAVVGDRNDPAFSSVLSSMQTDMQSHAVPGGSIAVVENGKLTFAAGLGVERAGTTDPVEPSTLFRVASLSKMIASATAMKLVEEGKLDLASPVTDYVPLTLATGFDASTVHVDHLLTHTSGIPDFGVASTCPVGAGQSAAYFAANGAQPLWTVPGEVWNYSNQGFAVAGWVIEAASGEPFEAAVQSRVFAPAGMTTATYDPGVARAGDHASGHTKSNGQLEPIEIDAYDCQVTRPPAGVIASVVDYAHFAETLLASGGAMITPSSVTAMTTGHVDTDDLPDAREHYGYGLFVRDGYKGLHVLRHDGQDLGYRSTIWMVPDRGFAVVVFYDADVHTTESIVKTAVDAFLDLAAVPAPDDATPPATWAKYAGTYAAPDTELGTVTVSFDGSKLTLDVPGLDPIALTQSAGDDFTASFEGESGSVIFRPDADGATKWLVTRRGVGVKE